MSPPLNTSRGEQASDDEDDTKDRLQSPSDAVQPPHSTLYLPNDTIKVPLNIVFPNSYDVPSKRSQMLIGAEISFGGPIQLRNPKVSVMHWSLVVVRAPVPETSVDEHCHSCPHKSNIWPAWQSVSRSETHAPAM